LLAIIQFNLPQARPQAAYTCEHGPAAKTSMRGFRLFRPFLFRQDARAPFERVVNRAFVGDGDKLLPRLFIKIALKPDDSLEIIDLGSALLRAVLTMLGVALVMPDQYLRLIEWQLFKIGI